MSPGDESCVRFLQWATPRLGMRWAGFRRVRRQVCRRVRARYVALGLRDHLAYQAYLEDHESEWIVLDTMCRVTISRFFRDRRVFEQLPALAEDLASRPLRVWSAGCASGEEPYSVALALEHIAVEIVATDADGHMLARARRAHYSGGTLRELDAAHIAAAFDELEGGYALRAAIRDRVRLLEQDVRKQAPEGKFDLILCRNLAFTYFDEATQREVLQRFADHCVDGGVLIIGAHEALPAGAPGWRGFASGFRRELSGVVE